MTRKRLSDVLRQEVSKDSATPEPAADAPKRSTRRKSRAQSKKATPSEASESASPETPNPLAAEVESLKNDLAQAHQAEAQLKKQLTSLEKSLKQRDAELADVQDALQDLGSLQSELKQAKEVILQLSEANTTLTDQLEKLQKPARTSLQTKPAAKRPAATNKVPAKIKTTSHLTLPPLPYHSVDHHHSAATEKSNKPKRIDIGWLD